MSKRQSSRIDPGGSLCEINAQIDEARKEIQRWQHKLETLVSSKQRIERELAPMPAPPTSRPQHNGKGKAKELRINYFDTEFEWSEGLRSRLKAVFGHESFRLCQEA